MTKKKLKTFSISFRVRVDTDIEIQAESFEDALTKAREYVVKDVVEFDTSHNDSSISISGVYDLGELS